MQNPFGGLRSLEERCVKELVVVPHDRPSARYLCVLTAFLDESGTHDKDLCVVAGFLGTDEQWVTVEEQWVQGLKKHNRKALHMKSLRWSKPHRLVPLLQTLGPIPVRCGLTRIFGVIRFADYEDLLPNDTDVKATMSPYMIAAGWCFARTFKNIPNTERVNFVFERQDKYSPWKYLPEFLFGTIFQKRIAISYVDKDCTPLTQPADYLAFAIRYMQISPRSNKAQMTKSIVGDGKGYGAQVSKDYMRHSIAQVSQWIERTRRTKEFNNLEYTMRQLLNALHSEIKPKLDAGKKAK